MNMFDTGRLPKAPCPSDEAPVSSARRTDDGAYFVVCGACRGVLRLGPGCAGKLGRCPSCLRVIRVPELPQDVERRRRLAWGATIVVCGMLGSGTFVLGLAGLLVALLGGAPAAPALYSLALGGGLALGAAVAACYGEPRRVLHAAYAVAAGAAPALILGGLSAAGPCVGLGLALYGAHQLLERLGEAAPATAEPRPSQVRVTSRPRPGVPSPVSA
ncbi:MAG: hypothetical protein R3F62_17715 [Planctomycetota bacterium]